MKTIGLVVCITTLVAATTADARVYSGREGLFLSPDRAGMIDGPNTYAYSRSNPTMFKDPTGRSIAFQDPELEEKLNDIESRSVQALYITTIARASSIMFVVQDGDLSQSPDITFGRLGPSSLVAPATSMCPLRTQIRVAIQIDKHRAATWSLKQDSEEFNSMTYYSAEEWELNSIYKDLRLTLIHEFLHAAQYVQAVDPEATWLLGFTSGLSPTPRYTGPQVAPDPEIAVPDHQEGEIRQIIKDEIYPEVSE